MVTRFNVLPVASGGELVLCFLAVIIMKYNPSPQLQLLSLRVKTGCPPSREKDHKENMLLCFLKKKYSQRHFQSISEDLEVSLRIPFSNVNFRSRKWRRGWSLVSTYALILFCPSLLKQ